MASNNRGQPLACQQKVVYLTRVVKETGIRCLSVHGLNDGDKPDKHQAMRPMRRKEVRLGTWNVTGVGSRECELADAMAAYKLDVMGVSEAWLRKGEEVVIPGFKWIGVAGENVSGKGGGVGFLVKDTIVVWCGTLLVGWWKLALG